MKLFNIILIGIIISLSAGQLNAQSTQCSNTTGFTGDRFYTHWSDSNGPCMEMSGDNNYKYTYTSNGNVVGGKGWEEGLRKRVIGYNCARFERVGSSGKLWLCAYGWMQRKGLSTSSKNRIIEYYVIDNYKGEWPLNGLDDVKKMGSTYNSDGGTYQAYRAYRYNAPNAYGSTNRDFIQYFSIRTSKRPLRRSNGSLINHKITMYNHFRAWHERCMKMGTTDRYMVMAIEGFDTGARTEVGVWEEGQTNSNYLGSACSKSGANLEDDDHSKPSVEIPGRFAPIAFPNPTSDKVIVKGLQEELVTIKIFNATGQQIDNVNILPVGGQTELDLSLKKPGFYLIQLTQGEQQQVLRVSRN